MLTAVAFVALAGCGSSDQGSTAVVPGGAVATAPQGAPDFCAEMTESEALTDLGGTFAELAEPSSASDGARDDLREAATSLARLAPENRHLHREFAVTARALRSLAAHPWADGATNRVAASLHALGKQLQGVCRFPRG
ncbi:MAG TPA: hypothetical protein VFM94_00110 [Solirubrobacterales bacterium]|nr:hypothetical protein [Solirubrobacterales bacterium]